MAAFNKTALPVSPKSILAPVEQHVYASPAWLVSDSASEPAATPTASASSAESSQPFTATAPVASVPVSRMHVILIFVLILLGVILWPYLTVQ
jgi:hypothetical protein